LTVQGASPQAPIRLPYPAFGKWLGVIGLCGLLTACQAPPPPSEPDAELIGTQDLVISFNSQKSFKRYRESGSSAYFAISQNGQATGWTYCAGPPDNCQGEFSKEQGALDYCKKDGGVNCRLFARGWEIIWKGPVRYAGEAPAGTAPAKVDKLLIVKKGMNPALRDLSVKQVCQIAVDYSSRPYEWSAKDEAGDYVAEARGRNLFIYQCAFETGHQ